MGVTLMTHAFFLSFFLSFFSFIHSLTPFPLLSPPPLSKVKYRDPNFLQSTKVEPCTYCTVYCTFVQTTVYVRSPFTKCKYVRELCPHNTTILYVKEFALYKSIC